MADIGDVYRISTTITDADGDLVDPAAVTLTVTDPSGTPSTPTPINDGTGLYHADVTLTGAGRWRWTWATTTPTGVDHGYVDVSADPPTRLFPLATAADIEARLRRPLTTTENAAVASLLIDASAAIRGATRPKQDFDHVVGDTVVVRPIGTILTLPQRPVTAVSSVVAIASQDGIPDVTLTGWRWLGNDEVEIGSGLGWRTAIDYDLEPVDYDCWSPSTYRVTYNHGYPTSPDDIRSKCCQLVLRCLGTGDNVTPEGQTQMTTGQYTEQWQQGTGAPGPVPVMTRADLADLVSWGYRRTASSIRIRL